MPSAGIAVVFACFVWWFSTGAILMLVRLPRRWHGAALAGFGAVAVLALWGLAATRGEATPVGALAGFTYGIVVWGFLETAFLLGFVTGPRRVAQSGGARGFERFRQAFETLAWHELSILAAGILLVALTFGSANEVGTTTFLVLWAMRISAKLNLFFGAPNVSAEFLPRHLDYLGSYFSRGRVSAFFPLSVTAASLFFGAEIHAAATATTDFGSVSHTLVATMFGLAILEHWFLVLPVPDSALWGWALKEPLAARAAEAEALARALPGAANDTPPAAPAGSLSTGPMPYGSSSRRVRADRRAP